MCNHTKILSVLNLTTSENDHEALAAIRTANQIIKKNKMTWNEFFKVPFKAEPPPPPPPKSKANSKSERIETETMLAYIRDNAWPEFDFTFIDSLEKSFDRYGSLTIKQFAALERIYNKIKGDE